MPSCFSCAQFFLTLWTVALQASLSVGFSKQEYWSGLPCPPPGDLPDQGIEPKSLLSPALGGEGRRSSLPPAPPGKSFGSSISHQRLQRGRRELAFDVGEREIGWGAWRSRELAKGRE